MTDVANYLRRITNDLETVCKKVLPDGFMVPKFSAQNFNAYSDDEVLKTILQDFLIMERTALDNVLHWIWTILILSSCPLLKQTS